MSHEHTWSPSCRHRRRTCFLHVRTDCPVLVTQAEMAAPHCSGRAWRRLASPGGASPATRAMIATSARRAVRQHGFASDMVDLLRDPETSATQVPESREKARAATCRLECRAALCRGPPRLSTRRTPQRRPGVAIERWDAPRSRERGEGVQNNPGARPRHHLHRRARHGGPALVANTYLEGTYSELYPAISQDAEGLKRLFKQSSFPGGIPSHVAPDTPGSIHEGGELGYSLSHAFGAAFDNPALVVACVIGDGEAETGPLATGWHGNKFLNPRQDGVVLPILHLNGYKIANPTVLARIERPELEALLRGYGYVPYFVEGDDPEPMHPRPSSTSSTRCSTSTP